ncbi:MAG TPA: gliding motility lipoprotein GldB [Flavobacteriaceae bacterium]|nr:gliding motility lipoprotein GldB [Flavobacteriaceae bacterium]
MLKKITFLSLIFVLFIACKQEDKIEKEIAQIPISFEVERFDEKFANLEPENLQDLKSEYPFLFPEQYHDSIWLNVLNDTIQHEINREVAKAFPEFSEEKEELHDLFQHLKYYFPEFEPPRVITITANVDYRNSVILSDGILLIGLDTYLGKEHEFYYGIQKYFVKNFIKSQIAPDVAREYAEKYIPRPTERELIAYMVYYGKIQYFKEKMLPHNSKASIIGYTDEEMEWAEENEREIWGYFVGQRLLYDTDPDLRRKFLDVGPFTRFGLQLDNESPPQLGQYIGWQIVKQYAEENKNISLSELIKIDNETIFKESNYKPKQR